MGSQLVATILLLFVCPRVGIGLPGSWILVPWSMLLAAALALAFLAWASDVEDSQGEGIVLSGRDRRRGLVRWLMSVLLSIAISLVFVFPRFGIRLPGGRSLVPFGVLIVASLWLGFAEPVSDSSGRQSAGEGGSKMGPS